MQIGCLYELAIEIKITMLQDVPKTQKKKRVECIILCPLGLSININVPNEDTKISAKSVKLTVNSMRLVRTRNVINLIPLSEF